MFFRSVNTLCGSVAFGIGAFVFGETFLFAQQTRAVRIGEYQFTIPSALELQRVSTEELTTWPIIADWDSQGRLLLVESGGVSKPIVESNQKLQHRLIRLDDIDNNGSFDRRTVIAKDLPFTEGLLCIGSDILVTSPPNIYRLIDADGDGVCEGREVWFDGQTITGCANDLHGPYLGRDGWVYWSKGAFAEQKHELLNGKKLTTSAAHIFRRRLSGGRIEPVMTGGMDNPVGLAITPEGERFFSSTFLHHSGKGLRDGIAHAVYGSVFGKDHRVLEGHVRTGPLMPVTIDLGAAAPSGLICLASNDLLSAIQPNPPTSNERVLVAALFNLQKVTTHRLLPLGASFSSQNADLVVADRIDFHPTDVLEDADGSLLIVDTGGWYDLCCPSSRVDQKAAAGGIYRLKQKNNGAQDTRTAAIDASKLSPAALVTNLTDPRAWVARQAQLRLLDQQDDAGESLAAELEKLANDTAQTLDHRLAYQWGLCTLGSETALRAIQKQLADADASVVQAACHALSLHRFVSARSDVELLLLHNSAAVRRIAAETLGRIGDDTSATALLENLQPDSEQDRHLQHSIAYALIELGAHEIALDYVAEQYSDVQRQTAMIVADQLGASAQIPTRAMLTALSSADAACRLTASEILAKHPQLAPRFVESMHELLNNLPASAETLERLIRGWRDTDVVKDLLAKWLAGAPKMHGDQQAWLARTLSLYANAKLPSNWNQTLSDWFEQASMDLRLEIAASLQSVDLSAADELRNAILSAATANQDDLLRWRLLASLPQGTALSNPRIEQQLLADLAADRPELSQAASAALQRVRLSRESGRQLVSSLKNLPPRTLTVAIEAVNGLQDDALDLSMLAALSHLPAARSLNPDQLLNLFRRRSSELRSTVEQSVAALARPPENVAASVDAVLAKLKPGDPIRGLQLFRSNKTACSSCHRLGHVGGEIGPELTRIGGSRSRSALLEAILFPSARLEQSYQPTKILTHDGQVYNGLITKYLTPTQFNLQLSADKSIVLNSDDIANQEPSQVSIMPSGMAELLSIEDIADLLTVLESAK